MTLPTYGGYTGFRECGVAVAEALTSWLAEHVAESERRQDRVREEMLARCRAELIEPPSTGRVTEIVRTALHRAEQSLLTRIAARLDSDPPVANSLRTPSAAAFTLAKSLDAAGAPESPASPGIPAFPEDLHPNQYPFSKEAIGAQT